jgi:hypothetical protein
VPLPDRKSEVAQRSAEPFEEQRAPRHVVPQQPHAAVAICESQRHDLVPCGVPGARDEELHHGLGTIIERGLGNEGLGRIPERETDSDGPLALDAGDQRRQFVEPVLGAGSECPVPHDRGNTDPLRGVVCGHGHDSVGWQTFGRDPEALSDGRHGQTRLELIGAFMAPPRLRIAAPKRSAASRCVASSSSSRIALAIRPAEAFWEMRRAAPRASRTRPIITSSIGNMGITTSGRP